MNLAQSAFVFLFLFISLVFQTIIFIFPPRASSRLAGTSNTCVLVPCWLPLIWSIYYLEVPVMDQEAGK